MKKSLKRNVILLILVAFVFGLVLAPSALAAGYSIGFATSEIQIADPPNSGAEVHGILPINGTASVDEVWFCVRGPHDEVEIQHAQVLEGNFSIEIALRFGPGQYTIWAGKNKTSFDGKIRFTTNNVVEDNRYTSPSIYVNCDAPEIVLLSSGLVNDDMTDLEKAKALHDWVAGNIEYDYRAYLDGDLSLKKDTQVLNDGKGVCSGYSFLYASLCRAAGLTAKVVYGQVKSSKGWASQQHAWNEVKIGDKWITVDNTWDAGYIKDGTFVAALTDEYFNSSPAAFALTHSESEDKLY